MDGSFKTNPNGRIAGKTKLPGDTISRSILAMYEDSTLFSGYFGNFADFPPVLRQMLDPKRIENHLKKPLSYYQLTEKDKKNYVLSIDQKEIRTPVDITIRKKRYQYTSLPVKFTNYSADTLKYINMDCSWTDIYFTNNKAVQFEKQLCFKNEPHVITVLPGQTVIINFPVIMRPEERNSDQKFRIGMSVQKAIKRQVHSIDDVPDFPFDYFLRPETANLIWSNEVEIKK
jgi:hypothetical protein